jgi:hypothetical protein
MEHSFSGISLDWMESSNLLFRPFAFSAIEMAWIHRFFSKFKALWCKLQSHECPDQTTQRFAKLIFTFDRLTFLRVWESESEMHGVNASGSSIGPSPSIRPTTICGKLIALNNWISMCSLHWIFDWNVHKIECLFFRSMWIHEMQKAPVGRISPPFIRLMISEPELMEYWDSNWWDFPFRHLLGS